MSTSRPPVVVGYDGSELSTAALDWAGDEARLRNVGVRVVVARGLATAMVPGMPVIPAWPGDVADSVLDEARSRLHEAHPDLVVTTDEVVGGPARVLIDASVDAEVVVVGRASQQPLTEAVVGSTSAQLVAHASCPVVVVDQPSGGPRVDRVVVGVDGSEAGQAALSYAFEEASLRRVPLIAVHAWWLDVPEKIGLSWLSEESVAKIAGTEEAVLSEALAGWSEKDPDVHITEVVSRERPVDAILLHARRGALIVVGGRGRGGFAGLVLGSVSQGLLHRPRECPLVVVPTRRHSE